MDLYKEILTEILSKSKVQVCFPDIEINSADIIEMVSYKALHKIKNIIEDDSLEDKECFIKIEEIIRLFELIGSDGGVRHDFG